MSRIGKKPVPLPSGVTAEIAGRTVKVKGPKGELSRTVHPDLAVTLEADQIVVGRPSDESHHKALHGLTRTLIAHMVEGVAGAKDYLDKNVPEVRVAVAHGQM